MPIIYMIFVEKQALVSRTASQQNECHSNLVDLPTTLRSSVSGTIWFQQRVFVDLVFVKGANQLFQGRVAT